MSTKHLYTLAVFCLSLGLLVAPESVRAGEPAESIDELSKTERQQVQSHVQAGKKAYDAGNFEASLEKFQRALEILEHPDFVYRVALAHEKLGHTEQALENYRKFLEMAPDADDRGKVERTIQRLEQELEQQRPEVDIATTPSGATVRLAGEEKPLGKTPLTTSMEPGRYLLVVTREGFEEARRQIGVESGEALALDIELDRAASAETDTSSESTHAGSGSSIGPYITFAGAGLAATGTLLSYLQFADARSTVRGQRACTPNCDKPESFDASVQRQKTWEAITWTSGAVATAALAGGTLWLVAGDNSGSSDSANSWNRRLSLVPTVSPDYIGLRLQFAPDFDTD
jgi:tetratricopeptide (TPR) repeat protein